MIRTILIITVFVAWVMLQAISTSDFVIGAYSQYDMRYVGINLEQKFDLLGDYLRNAGFNATTYSILRDYDFSSNNLGKALEKLEADNVKTLLLDLSWQNNNGEIGVGSLSFGNRLQMEAEYMLITDTLNAFQVDELETGASAPASEEFDYIFKHKTGNRMLYQPPDTLFSNNYAWVCDEALGDSAGVALSYPRKRWKASYRNWPQLLSEDLMFYQSKDYEDGYTGSPVNENRLYLTVAMRFDNVEVTQPVANVRLKLLQIANDDDYNQYVESYDDVYYTELTLTSTSVTAYGTTIFGQEYPANLTDSFENYKFEFYVDLPDYNTPLYHDLLHRGYFYHINPEIEWLGNGKMIIDYIILEDEFARSLRIDQQNSPFISRLDDHIDTLETLDATTNNILYYYTKDEPYHGQMKMYDYLENLFSDKLLTALFPRNKDIVKHNNKRFNHPKLFLNEANPKRIMVEIYPITFLSYEGWVNPNHFDPDFGHDFVQDRIDSYLHYYYHSTVRNVMESSNPDVEIFYVPQQYGNWKANTGYWSDHMPPRNMSKCLQLLPLCYAADGVVSFALTSNPIQEVEDGYWVTPLACDYRYSNLRLSDYTSAYVKLIEANAKLAVYGQLIKNCEWIGANKIMTNGMSNNPELNDMVSLNSVYLDDIHVVNNATETLYQGYVQGGFYMEDNQIPSYMLVNRRAVDIISNPPSGDGRRFVDNCFQDANPQSVLISPNSLAGIDFGTHLALYDPYDSSLHHQNNAADILVEIGPGDGKLLQMVASLPAEVEDHYSIKKKGVLSGEIVVAQGGAVSVEAGTDLTIKAGSQITISSGASINFRGEVTIEDSVSIIVEENGLVSFTNAECKWGNNSALIVDAGTLEIDGGSFASTDTTAIRWSGISASNSSVVTFNNCTIADAFHNSVTNSFLSVTNTTFKVPASSYGLIIKNDVDGYDTIIMNTEESRGFFGDNGANSKGLTLGAMRNTAIIHNVFFYNMSAGLVKVSNIGEQDSIAYCNFSSCIDGIKIISSNYYGRIQNCVFNNNHTGIKLNAAIPYINNCSFVNNTVRGILSEYSIFTFGLENGIYNSNFTNNPIGLESRGSNHRIETSYFNNNVSALINHGGSNLYLGNNANNVFRSQVSNLEFCDSLPYEATIQLFEGHNDFYHQFSTSYDFAFDENYYNFPLIPDHTIDASKNWFEDEKVVINDSTYEDYVLVEVFDPEANMPPPPFENDRISVAMSQEALGEYETACEMYAAILNDPLESELRYLPIAADGVFRYAVLITDPDWVTTEFFDEKAIQYEIDNPALCALLEV